MKNAKYLLILSLAFSAFSFANNEAIEAKEPVAEGKKEEVKKEEHKKEEHKKKHKK